MARDERGGGALRVFLLDRVLVAELKNQTPEHGVHRTPLGATLAELAKPHDELLPVLLGDDHLTQHVAQDLHLGWPVRGIRSELLQLGDCRLQLAHNHIMCRPLRRFFAHVVPPLVV